MLKDAPIKQKALSLSVILALAFFVLSVLILVVSGGIQIAVYSRSQAESVSGKLRIIAADASHTVSNFINEKFSILNAIAASISGNSSERKSLILESIVGLYPEIRHLILVDPQGIVLVYASHLSRVKAMQFYSMIESDYPGMKQVDKYIGNVHIDPQTSEPLVTIAVHDKNVFGEIRGSLIAEMNLKFMWDLMDTIKVGTTGHAFVVDKQGKLIAFRDSARVLKGESVGTLNPVHDFASDSKVAGISLYKGITNVRVVGLYVALKTPDWAVVTEMPVSEADAEITQNTLASIFIMIVISVLSGLVGVFLARRITIPLVHLTRTAAKIAQGDTELVAEVKGSSEVNWLANTFNIMTSQLKDKAEGFRMTSEVLARVITKAQEIIVSLNSSSKEIEAASQEQTSGASEYASAITEVSATLQELTITAKQITNNIGELVFSSEEVSKLLKESEKQLLETVSLLDEVGSISKTNSEQIAELGKRSAIINEMVELIKEVANKTNILSINASIEASRSGEAGAGFSVVAAEIRELSKETIESAKKAETAAREIREFLSSIIISSENESTKVIGSGRTAKSIFDNMESIVSKINNNYSFTQKIDVSIKQQESGSVQAAETMRQMAEIARQSAETARQTLAAAKDIVSFSSELDSTVSKIYNEGRGV